MVLLFVDGNLPTWHAFSIILVAFLQFSLVVSLGFFLAALNVFFRDLGYALPSMLLVLLFATPIFYPIDSTPRVAQLISTFNPFYIIAEGYRQPLVYHQLPNFAGLCYVALLSLLLGYAGLLSFRRVKGYFEAVL
ncbi:MAG: ABC transporter permease [Pyrinomonadaceae bacterium]